MKGKVYLVGAGPGKADLITVRGLNILKEADVVIYDYLVDKSLLEYTKKGAELICCDELGKKRYSNGFLIHQEKINQLLTKKAKEGKKVVRLKNGDPSIFGRLSQELEILHKNKIDFEIVPGVTAASAASAFSGIPLTDRRFASSCVFVTGHEDPTKKKSLIDWKSIAKQATVVLYMAVENISFIVKKLIEEGMSKDTPIAIIQDVSLITQKTLITTLKDILKLKTVKVKPPAIIIIGKTVKLEKKFNWLKKSKKILFTGLSGERFFLKGTYFHLPLIKIEPIDDYREFDNHLKNISDYDWVIFTSRYGVEYFFKRLQFIGYDSRILKDVKIAAIGNSTKNRLLDFGIKADLVPKKESSEGLLREFKKIDLKGKKIFLPRSNLSDKGLAKGLASYGAEVISSVAYKNVMPRDLPDLPAFVKTSAGIHRSLWRRWIDLNFFNEIMFTSPSTVRNFKKRYARLPQGIKIKCIGDVTLREARKCKLLG